MRDLQIDFFENQSCPSVCHPSSAGSWWKLFANRDSLTDHASNKHGKKLEDCFPTFVEVEKKEPKAKKEANKKDGAKKDGDK